jgi:hypothetical protein
MISKTSIHRRLATLPHYHLISYLYQAEAGYHVVLLRCRAVKFAFPIHTEEDFICKVAEESSGLLATLVRPPFTSFVIAEHETPATLS